jgi:hypothetical protein
MELLNVLIDKDEDGLCAQVRETETDCGFRYTVTLTDQETGEELPNTRRVFKEYIPAFDYAKQATNQEITR